MVKLAANGNLSLQIVTGLAPARRAILGQSSVRAVAMVASPHTPSL